MLPLDLVKDIVLSCSHCNREYQYSVVGRCLSCAAPINPVYALDRVSIHESSVPLERYFDVTPLQRSSSIVQLGDGNTPLIAASNLGLAFGLNALFLKDETSNPTRTTKDRMSAAVLSQCKELGIHEFVTCSTGNSSTSLAYGMRYVDDITLHLFCGSKWLRRHAFCEHERVHLHIIDGDFVRAEQAAREFSRERHIHFEGGFFNYARREGLKLAYLEAFEQLRRLGRTPETVVQAISSGMGLYGAWRGALQWVQLGWLPRSPRFVAVQQETCAPMVMAFRDGANTIAERHIVRAPTGLAEAILRGDPTASYPYVLEFIRDTGGCFTAPSEPDIQDARQMLLTLEGIDACFASATALAGVRQLAQLGWLKESEVVLVNLTGGIR